MNINKKILMYLEKKGYSQRHFTKMIGLSAGALKKGDNIGSKYISAIRENFPDLNINWLLFDKGEMIIADDNYTHDSGELSMVSEQPISYNSAQNTELIACQKKIIELQNEIRDLEKLIFELKLEKNNIFTKLKKEI